MKIVKTVFSGFLIAAIFSCLNASAQAFQQQKECELNVETKVTNPDVGKRNGKIELTFKDTSRKYKVFLINAGENNAKRDQGNVIDNLSKGFYDIMITDDKGCFKQITITLN